MSRNIIEKRGKTLAPRSLVKIARTSRRAADEIIAESRIYSLDKVSIRELLAEGRRG